MKQLTIKKLTTDLLEEQHDLKGVYIVVEVGGERKPVTSAEFDEKTNEYVLRTE